MPPRSLLSWRNAATGLQKLLKDAGVRASRLGDIALARLYRACWGHANAGEQRFDRDVQAFFVAAGSA